MNIHLDNVNLGSTSGPNSFAGKLVKYGQKNGCAFEEHKKPDAYLSFIETYRTAFGAPMYQRVDGIYFNKDFDYNSQNRNIKSTYEHASGVIYQSNFNENYSCALQNSNLVQICFQA